MADKNPNSEIEYTPEELEEIERIVGSLPGSTQVKGDEDILSLSETEQEEAEEVIEETPLEEMDFGDVPSDLSELETMPLDDLQFDDFSDDESFSDIDLSLPTEDEPAESAPVDEPELLDITDSITEIPDVSEEEVSFDLPEIDDEIDFETEALDDLDTSPELDDISPAPEDYDNVDLSGIDLPPIEEEAEKPTFSYKPRTIPKGIDPNSTLGQLNTLTENEPDSVDAFEISTDVFTDSDDEEEESPEKIQQQEPALEEFSEPEPEITLSGETDTTEMPDLDSLDLSDDLGGLDEGDLSDLPDVDFEPASGIPDDEGAEFGELPDDLGSFSDDESELSDIGSELGDFDAGEFDGMEELTEHLETTPVSEPGGETPELEPIDSVSDFEDELPDIHTDVPGIEPIDDEDEEVPRPSEEKKGLDFTPDELKKLKKALLLFPNGLTDAIKDTILNDRLSEADTRRLADMILQGRPEDNIHRFLEKKLKQKIDKKGKGSGRRVILSRPEYSREGRERQKMLLRRTRNIALGVVAVLAIGIAAYRMIYIPEKAKSLIAQGTQLIRKFNEEKFPDYQKAEEIAQLVDDKYIKDYIYAYNEYGRAYFDKKEYFRSLMKLNKAFDLGVEKNFSTRESVRTLNELGYFFSSKKRDVEGTTGSFEDFFQKSVKLNLDKYYFSKVPAINEVETQYDLALDFYQKALNKDPDNIESLLGIGDVYQNQGQYLKARKYYENILEVDKNSIAGHAGLINLFIEQDNFPETVSEYVNLRDRNDLEKVPSALLAKLANYFLSKSKTKSQNIRIDYGIQSPRLKDSDDQPFPAVVEVLKALRKRDENYPPLYTTYAYLSLKQKNVKLAKEYLENGLKRAEKQGYSFFAGNQMMGEFYYYTKEPDMAYKHFKQAIRDYNSPPEYVYDRYYEETEELGDTYTMLGNIFYYFFDSVRFRTGDQETMSEIELRQNEDMMGNYNIAKDYYEEALGTGYETPELHYNLGRVHYLNRQYSKARDQWLNLYDEFTVSPELMLGLGNVFYKLGNYDTAQMQFMKLASIYEYEADKIRQAMPENREHHKIFSTLARAYNNLGAVYQKQGQLDQSAIAYWNAVEYSRKIEEESEFARVNLGKGVKERETPVEPVLDDNIPYSIDYYREDMRW